jgi:hypothetical protein
MENSSSANPNINDSYLVDKEKDQGYFKLKTQEYKEVLEDSSQVCLILKFKD